MASGGKDKVLKMYEILLAITVLLTLFFISGGKINKFYYLMMGFTQTVYFYLNTHYSISFYYYVLV